MDNSSRDNDKDNNDVLSNKSNTPKEQKTKRKISKNEENSSVPNKLPLLDEVKINGDKIAKSNPLGKSSAPEDLQIGPIKKFEMVDGAVKNEKKEGKKRKDGANRKFIRKNAKKANNQKKKEGNGNNSIKVVGNVSAKLSALIQRLGQNTETSGNANKNQYGEKVVMAPRIKAALEKFNKKKEDKPEIQHFGGNRYRKKKALNEDKDNKDGISNGNNYEEEEEYEYEEDEDYEYEEEEEEEEKENEKKENEIRKAAKKKSTKKKKKKKKKNKKKKKKKIYKKKKDKKR